MDVLTPQEHCPDESQSDETRLMGGAVRLFQPLHGYRTAIDPVFLAAAVTEGPWTSALDVGTGTGAALLCLCVRLPDKQCTGLELLDAHASLARRSIKANGCGDRASVIIGDLRDRRGCRLVSNSFDQVVTNPPFHRPGRRPEHPDRALAMIEEVPLAEWIDFCLRMLRPRGHFAMIHRADRLEEILSALCGRTGGIEVIPLWPKQGVAAKRVIIRARKGVKSPTILHSGLIIHRPDGTYTEAADAVLRQGLSLDQALGITAT